MQERKVTTCNRQLELEKMIRILQGLSIVAPQRAVLYLEYDFLSFLLIYIYISCTQCCSHNVLQLVRTPLGMFNNNIIILLLHKLLLKLNNNYTNKNII